jgi:hypothetical protein
MNHAIFGPKNGALRAIASLICEMPREYLNLRRAVSLVYCCRMKRAAAFAVGVLVGAVVFAIAYAQRHPWEQSWP